MVKSSILIVILISIFFSIILLSIYQIKSFEKTWKDKQVNIPSISMQGVVLDTIINRSSRILKIRLKNGNIISVSTDQVELIKEPTK
jgi:hypothetical protein